MEAKQPPAKAKKKPEALHNALKDYKAVSAKIRLADGTHHCWDGEEFTPC